jgi:glycosyltransferase involved in cell wall biosynthesis
VADNHLRILQVAPWSVHGSGTGGMAAVVRDLTAELRRQGHDVEILTNAWEATEPRRDGAELRLRLPGPPISKVDLAFVKWPLLRERAARTIVALCRREGIQVIHAHYAGPYLATLARARALGGPPFVVTCHRGDVLAVPDLSAHRRRAVIAGMRAASARVAVSGWLAGEAAEVFGLDHLDTVPNGFQPAWDQVPPRAEVEAAVGRALPERYAVMVGNMRAYKGHKVALQAWRQMDPACELPLVFVGGGPDLDDIRSLSHDYGVADRVMFCGYLPRQTTLGVMAHARMVVAPSRSEGHPIFALEAGALARPLVCTDIPPLLDIVEHGSSALTVPPDDPVALAAAVQQLETDPCLCTTLGERLKAVVDENFSVERMARLYVDHYTSAFSKFG